MPILFQHVVWPKGCWQEQDASPEASCSCQLANVIFPLTAPVAAQLELHPNGSRRRIVGLAALGSSG